MKPDTVPNEALPSQIPIFPLPNALLLPGGQLPLNIFEPRYLAMIEDALGSPGRLIGMVQPLDDDGTLFGIGCAGRISYFQETGDGRYMIALSGVCRFRLTGTSSRRAVTGLPMSNGTSSLPILMMARAALPTGSACSP